MAQALRRVVRSAAWMRLPVPSWVSSVGSPQLAHPLEIPKSKTEFNWADYNVVSDVTDQGEDSETCYAHATVSAVESLYAIKTGEMVKLSIQEVIDNVDGVNGEGGTVLDALDWIETHGLSYASDYRPHDGIPRKTSIRDYKDARKVTIDSYVMARDLEEESFLDLLRILPLIANIEVGPVFDQYSGGIYYGEPSSAETSLHSILVTGVTNDCFIGKNSHGLEWGENGIIYIHHSLEAIRKEVYYPIIHG